MSDAVKLYFLLFSFFFFFYCTEYTQDNHLSSDNNLINTHATVIADGVQMQS